MNEAGIGRVLIASLHQAISDILPTRLEFYESWLNPDGLRLGTVGRAPLNAVLSFLRLEGEAYHSVVARAGEYAAEWSVASQSPARRAAVCRLPAFLRTWIVLGMAKAAIRRSHTGARTVTRLRKGHGSIVVTGSVFCAVRDTVPAPLCGYYGAVISRFLGLYEIEADVRTGTCRGCGGDSCTLELNIR